MRPRRPARRARRSVTGPPAPTSAGRSGVVAAAPSSAATRFTAADRRGSDRRGERPISLKIASSGRWLQDRGSGRGVGVWLEGFPEVSRNVASSPPQSVRTAAGPRLATPRDGSQPSEHHGSVPGHAHGRRRTCMALALDWRIAARSDRRTTAPRHERSSVLARRRQLQLRGAPDCRSKARRAAAVGVDDQQAAPTGWRRRTCATQRARRPASPMRTSIASPRRAPSSSSSPGPTLSWQLPKRSTQSTSAVDLPVLHVRAAAGAPGVSDGGSISRAEHCHRDAVGDVRDRGRHDVAAGERRARRRQLVLLVLERRRSGRGPPSIATAGASRPLSGPTSTPCSTSTAMQRRSVPTPGSTTASTSPSGRYCTARRERERAGPHVERRNVVGDVDDAQLRRDVEHHRVADADELVGAPVVGEERDELGARRHRRDATGERSERSDAGRYPACV